VYSHSCEIIFISVYAENIKKLNNIILLSIISDKDNDDYIII